LIFIGGGGGLPPGPLVPLLLAAAVVFGVVVLVLGIRAGVEAAADALRRAREGRRRG
jgi:hypothetical protein